MSNETDAQDAALPEEPQPQTQELPEETSESQPTPEAPAPAAPDAEPQDESHKDSGSEKAMRFLANAMPWVISLLLHCGLVLILVFMVFFVVPEVKVDQLVIPDSFLTDDPGGQMNPNPASVKTQATSKSTRKKIDRKITKVTADTGTTKNAISVIGVEGASAGSAGADMGMATSSGGPGNRFFGLGGGNAYNVVYVIDGSGSMEISGAFKAVCDEMYRSIARLTDKQTFSVILYTAGKPEECSRSLMPASKKNKKKAADFLSQYSGAGLSNPIPALDRAFTVLRGATKPGRLIYLLSDGEFKGEGTSNEKVLSTIRTLNADKKVNINTLLFGSHEKTAIQVMQQIADQNKGQYKFIDWGG